MSDLVTIARQYLHAIESGAVGHELAKFLDAQIEYEELPNRLFPNGRKANRDQMLVSAAKGQQVLESQRYEVLSAVTSGSVVVLEVRWSGRLKVAFGALPVGEELHDRSAIILEFSGEKIIRQRNYDCYEPW